MSPLRRILLTAFFVVSLAATAHAQPRQPEPLASWNEGATKRAILDFVRATIDPGSPQFVPPAARVATFDQDGTLWVEQPMYTQLVYCLEQLPEVVEKRPELRNEEPFKTALSGDKGAIAKLPRSDLEKILAATLTGMTVERFAANVRNWLATARHPRWNKPYTSLVFQPMLEVMQYLRSQEYKVYIVTGGGQDFVRAFAEVTYGVPPENVVGTMGQVHFQYDAEGRPTLIKEPKVMLIDDGPGKPEGIHMMIGRRPVAAFGNSGGDRQMLEYTRAGTGARLAMLVLHDDEQREFAYGPANGLPDSKIGTFDQALYDQAQKQGWHVISMKRDWKRIFAFETPANP